MKIVAITGWLCLAVYATIAASVWISGRNATGDRAMGLIIPVVMTPLIVLFAAILGLTQYRGWTSAAAVTTALLLLPIFILGPTVGGNLLSSLTAKRYQSRSGQFREPRMAQMADAIRQADTAALSVLLAGPGPIDWSARDKAGSTILGFALDQAIRSTTGSTECLEALVRAGAPYRDDDLRSDARVFPVMLSRTLANKDQLLDILLRAGANPNDVDTWGAPALIGVFMEAPEAKVLLRHGAELAALRSERDGEWNGWNALMVAAGRARWDLAQLYLEHGCDPAFRAPDGQTVLDVARQMPASRERDAFLSVLRKSVR